MAFRTRWAKRKNGVTLCGLGTGGLQIRTDGSFGYSSLQNNWVEEIERLVAGSFLAVSVAGSSGRCTRMLQAETVSGISAMS